MSGECLWFNVPFHIRPTPHLIHVGHFGDESFQAIDCIGTDKQIRTKRKYTKHKITNPNTNKLALVKTQKYFKTQT